MQDIRLVINEYGPIRNAELQFAPMMVFTGNSNLGKSYVNYLWYYFMSAFTPMILTEFVNSKFVFGNEVEEFTLRTDDFRLWINAHAESFLRKLLNDDALVCNVNFIFRLGKESLKIRLERTVQQAEGEENSYVMYRVNVDGDYTAAYPEFFDPDGSVVFALGAYLQRALFGRTLKTVILPPARGALVGENFTVKDKVSRSSGLYANFLQDYDYALRSLWGKSRDEQFFNARIKKLMGGELDTREGVQYLQLPTGRTLPLSAAASSIRELGPLMFYLKNHYGTNVSFCLEEPEAHLHPRMQVDVADMLAICLNRGYMFQLTTHSDYMMQRFNQLIKLGMLRQADGDRLEAYMRENALNKDTYLDKEQIKGYYFHSDEDGEVVVTGLEITDEGLPMASFFDIVADLSNRENDIDALLGAVAKTGGESC
ncbi:MAG: AAA family ATPase [Clostridium sp.]|nr:AAA family ATPase [Clostridium sp.]